MVPFACVYLFNLDDAGRLAPHGFNRVDSIASLTDERTLNPLPHGLLQVASAINGRRRRAGAGGHVSRGLFAAQERGVANR